jgi:hypothetical protein
MTDVEGTNGGGALPPDEPLVGGEGYPYGGGQRYGYGGGELPPDERPTGGEGY